MALVVGMAAREIRTATGSVTRYADERQLMVYGKDVMTGLPKEVRLTREEIREVLRPDYGRLVDLAVVVLEGTPPELAGDVLRDGLLLTGPHPWGAAQMLGESLQLPVRSAGSSDPVLDGARAFHEPPPKAAQ
ncbi:rod shape-determining protein [Streptomyces sp. SCA3-4]|uniref:rod shape-determining protein n=1 Tax=Streptomyces sichuanensis TaxID=2871810 RepID=UPI001CE267D6|nr:rod shape-determining protein [Streptomyces sichuanensis]MCA6095523.1 rod shape-determining protein [Streptomyces sichuanensis]